MEYKEREEKRIEMMKLLRFRQFNHKIKELICLFNCGLSVFGYSGFNYICNGISYFKSIKLNQK